MLGRRSALEPAHLHPLRDGLLSLTQSIRTMLVDASGGREVDNLWVHEKLIAVGGLAAAPLAIVGGRGRAGPTLLQLRASGWVSLAEIPGTCAPQALASDGQSIVVGCEGEAALELR